MTAALQEFRDRDADMAAMPGNQNAHRLAPHEEKRTMRRDWIFAVLSSNALRAEAIAEEKPRFCGKVFVDTRIRPA